MPKIGKKKFEEQNVYDAAIERIHECFKRFDKVVVSFSGGKDSTVVFQLTYEVAQKLNRLPLEVLFWDEEAISPETEDYVRRVSKMPGVDLKWYCLPITHRNGCSRKHPYWFPWDPDCKEKWVRPLPSEAITADMVPGFNRQKMPHCEYLFYKNEKQMICLLTGVRASESIRRYQSVASQKTDNYFAPRSGSKGGYPQYGPEFPLKNVMAAKPIYDWVTDDVWVAPHRFSWDYNRSYDIFDKAGISKNSQRVAPPYGEEPMLSLWMWAVCWPQLWDLMSDRVPGAATAARYSRSELYSFGSRPQRPPDLTWMEFIGSLIRKFPPKDAAMIAKRIKREIQFHYTKTQGRPIPEKDPDLDSGMSWEFLAMIALRGDFKGRKTTDGERTKANIKHENNLKKAEKNEQPTIESPDAESGTRN